MTAIVHGLRDSDTYTGCPRTMLFLDITVYIINYLVRVYTRELPMPITRISERPNTKVRFYKYAAPISRFK